ncbi:MAG TPA: helix-turn-helix domain-containing protein, partial [Candidatus Limnocylindria bacterium]|nr:helix-turn-helix domain-containing protein [Candidatus Limnocylindria bacterium]
YVTGETIRALREKKGYTQRNLADLLQVSDKAVSKWETGRGLPDISLLEPLGAALGVSIAELLSGRPVVNRNRAGNMLRGAFSVCPICGNILFSSGPGSFSCCGVALPPLEAEVAEGEHAIEITPVEDEHYVRMDHPMGKAHHVSFLAHVTQEAVRIVKLYPEGDAAARFRLHNGGRVYAYCANHGLFVRKL